MSPQPYFDTDRDIDVPVDHGPANECAMCGAINTPLTWGVCCIEDRYFAGYRCAEPLACRTRREQPLDQPTPTPPDAEPEEADCDYI
jgi:hypothetical protein